MLGGIRRIVGGKDDESSDWDVNLPLEKETEEEPEIQDSEFLQPLDHPEPTKGTVVHDADYYRDLVRASIASGGKFGDQKISVYWLQTILDGLEGRDTEDSIWRAPRFEDSLFGGEPGIMDETGPAPPTLG